MIDARMKPKVEIWNVHLIGPMPLHFIYFGTERPTEQRKGLIHIQQDEEMRVPHIRIDMNGFAVLPSAELERLRYWDVRERWRKACSFIRWLSYPVRHPVSWLRQARRFKRDAEKMLRDAGHIE